MTAFAASVEVVKGDDGDHVVLRNALVRLEVNPNDGAKVESYQVAAWGNKEIIAQPKYQGLFADHFWQEYWPGQMWAAKYAYKIVSAGPDEVAVTFSYLAQDKGVPQVAGIQVEKTISLREGSKVVRDSVRLTNTNQDGRSVGYWLQNVAWLGGDAKEDLYFRPSKRGVSVASSDDKDPPDAGFVRSPQAGWMGAIDQGTKQGLVFLMDWNDLWFLYNCTSANTMEWQYEAVAIPPGKSWQTEVTMIPITGLDSVSYASEQLLMSAKMSEDKAAGKLEVSETFAAAEAPIASLDVTTALEILPSNHKETAPAQIIGNLTAEPKSVQVSLSYDTLKREPAVVRVALGGKTAAGEFSATPELWYGGSMVANTNPTDGSPFYPIPSAPKVRHLLKPDKIERIHAATPQVLYLKGLLAPQWRLEAALRRALPGVDVTECYMYNGVFGGTLDAFPYDYDKLMACDVVVIGDVSAAALGDTAMEMLSDYVQHGGRLLVLGGPLAYGSGGYRGSLLEKVLPVVSGGPFDLQPCASPGPTEAAGALAGIAPYEFSKDNWVHRGVTVKPDAQVLLKVGATPLVVEGRSGQGTAVCVLATPVGPQDWCASRQWREALERLVK
jgi:uncharacterized membrane protein